MGIYLKIGIVSCIMTSALIASTIEIGSDGSGPLQLFDSNGNPIAAFGPATGTASALDAAGGLFVAIPGDTSSTIDEFDSSQNLLNTFSFTAPTDMRMDASYITDMAWGASGTLWISTFSGEIYHLAADGSILSSFDTGVTAPGIAFDGTNLYTTSGPGFMAASPFIYQRDTSGNVLNTINTGLNDTLGIAYDSSSSTFWIGGFDVVSQVDPSGSVLQAFPISGTHYGVEAGDLAPASTAAVPEPSTWIFLLTALAALGVWKLRANVRIACSYVVAALALPALHAAVSISSFTPDLASPQPVGTSITFTANASDTDSGPLRYRFEVRQSGGAFAMLRDFSPATSVVWTPSETDGSYEIRVTVLNRQTTSTQALSAFYTVSPRATGSAIVTPTSHPLVALYSAPACAAGSSMRVRFKLPSDIYWQTTPLKACSGTSTTNFYVAGMRPSTTYQLRHDVITGPHVASGPILTFTTGALPLTLPSTDEIIPLKAPTSMTEGVTLFSGLDTVGYHPYAVDAGANVIWYAPTTQVYLTRPVSGGGYLVTYGFGTDLANSGLRQYDLAGNLVKETNVEQMNVELAAAGMNPVTVFHHEIRELPNGNYMVLAMREVASAVQGPPDDIAGDMILVLDNNLQLLWSWDSFAHLDVTRPAVLGETCFTGPGRCVLFNSSEAHDWTHGNSAALTPDGNILYSSRHQDLVYKIAYQNGAGDGHVIWKLGKDGDFTWVSNDPYPWFSHQHEVEYEDAATISLFDNGNTRVTLQGGNSRGQALHIDEVNRLVTPILNVDLGGFSDALGSAERLLNGSYMFGNDWIAGAPNTQVSEWTTTASEVSNIHSASVNYRSFRMRDLYSAP